jgi:uncharacterized membrane protein YkoI
MGKTVLAILISACGAGLIGPLGGVAWADDDVTFESLPKAAQEAVKKHVGSGRITGIEREDDAGRTTYEVEWRTPQGQAMELEVDATGKVIKSRPD